MSVHDRLDWAFTIKRNRCSRSTGTRTRAAKFWAHLKGANEQANPELIRLALKLATGAGKTTVMAMLIAWHAVNAARHPSSKTFSRGFLIVAPGITIRDRLSVLQDLSPSRVSRRTGPSRSTGTMN